MFPLRMEEIPARHQDAVSESLELVNRADLYIGVFGFRYGYVPPGHEVSIVELEYERALERGIPRLLFLMHPGHPITVDDVDSDRGKARIDALRTRIEKDRVVAYFRSPEELRTLVLDSLRRLETDRPLVLHPDTDIPRARTRMSHTPTRCWRPTRSSGGPRS